MSRLSLFALLMASVPSTAFADHGERSSEPPPEPRAHVEAKRAPCPPSLARQHPERCLPVGKKLAHKPAKARTVLSANVSIGHGTRRHVSGSYRTGQVSYRRSVSPSHMAAQRAMLAPPPPVHDMSGYNTGLFVAPAGTPYPLTEPKPGDYICTSAVVPLDTKVLGMHPPKPHPPCGYKWAWDGGSGKAYWWLKPDPNYGVRH